MALDSAKISILVIGTADCIAEIAEMLAWLSTAFASSRSDVGTTYCRPSISRFDGQISRAQTTENASAIHLSISCSVIFPNHKADKADGQCWQGLFQNPVAVYGYPILRRPQPQTGLEIPLHIAASLLDEERVQFFEGRPYIKGFNAMLVPTEKFDGLIIWHFLLKDEHHRISYLDSKASGIVETNQAINLADLESHRHIVGWCSNSTYHAGKGFRIRTG